MAVGRRRRRPNAAKATFAASGSQWMFHSVVGAVLPGWR